MSRRLKPQYLLFAVAALAVTALSVFIYMRMDRACSVTLSRVEIAHPASITFLTRSQRVDYLTVTIVGFLDGEATFTTHDGRQTTVGPGSVEEVIAGDFYSSRTDVEYRPIDVSSGELVITCKLESMSLFGSPTKVFDKP